MKIGILGTGIVDIVNALDFSKGMPPILLTHDGNSLGEQLQQLLPRSKVVKTLNTVSAQLQVDPLQLVDGDHVVFVSGNDAEAKKPSRAFLRVMVGKISSTWVISRLPEGRN